MASFFNEFTKMSDVNDKFNAFCVKKKSNSRLEEHLRTEVVNKQQEQTNKFHRPSVSISTLKRRFKRDTNLY